METPQEFMGSNDHTQLLKRKRTKRQKPPSPHGGVTITSTSSTSYNAGEYGSISSPTTSGEISTVEDEDMANCLILLAQGNRRSLKSPAPAGTTNYECKTCDRSFPSFQALGGHRASHKRPKAPIPATNVNYEESILLDKNQSFISPEIINRTKIHECSICGLEFGSGQALGGHMRRHRPSASVQTAVSGEKSRNILGLDLNLPAPEDDWNDSNFQFPATQQSMVFSVPALVDCYY